MFNFDPYSSYTMPAHFGSRHSGGKSTGWYHDVTMMIVPYLTDREKLAAHLPEQDNPSAELPNYVSYAFQ